MAIATRGSRAWVCLGLLAATLLLVAGGGSGDGSGDGDYMAEERCQPVDDTSDPTDGSIPSPEELLPDPEACPEFYEGGDVGAAPPVSVNPGEPYVPSEPSPCSTTGSLNGFPCTNGPDGPIYITPDPSYPD